MKFENFSTNVDAQFTYMSKLGTLLKVNVSKEELWNTYINSFPAGTDPIYMTETEHTCNCCKSFIHQVGAVVIVINKEVSTIWDNWENLETPYKEVSRTMQELILSCDIDSVYRPGEPEYGAQITYTDLVGSPDKLSTFNHFFCSIPEAYHKSNHDRINAYNNNFIPAKKSLEEISTDSVLTVLDLITTDSIYRGEEHKTALLKFQEHQKQLKTSISVDNFVWERITDFSMAIRNTVIGSLLIDLSKEEKTLEQAVASFEAKVAPENYKRPKALITQSMIDSASKTIEELGIGSALTRRHATEADIRVSDILYVDSQTSVINDGPLATLKPQKRKPSKTKEGTSISVTEFITTVLPNSKSLKVLLENRHVPNLVNILAAQESDAPNLFKWDNPFSWSYNGGVADSSIKDNVAKAGGNVTGEFRASLAWSDSDDLDISMRTPTKTIYYGQKRASGGVLDVDMNAGQIDNSKDPVENITWTNFSDMPLGKYEIIVNNYTKRSNSGKGFTIELEIKGDITQYTFPRQLSNKAHISCIEFEVTDKGISIEFIHPDLSSTAQSKDAWGLDTEEYQDVSLLTLSPNYWGEDTGNKHFMFILKNCLNPEPVRGIYNEFLNDNLTPHRKVFEVLATKTLCPYSESQLAGLGFSSTKRNTLSVLVDGRPFTVQI